MGMSMWGKMGMGMRIMKRTTKKTQPQNTHKKKKVMEILGILGHLGSSHDKRFNGQSLCSLVFTLIMIVNKCIF